MNESCSNYPPSKEWINILIQMTKTFSIQWNPNPMWDSSVPDSLVSAYKGLQVNVAEKVCARVRTWLVQGPWQCQDQAQEGIAKRSSDVVTPCQEVTEAEGSLHQVPKPQAITSPSHSCLYLRIWPAPVKLRHARRRERHSVVRWLRCPSKECIDRCSCNQGFI